MRVSFQTEGKTDIRLDLKDRKLLTLLAAYARLPHTQIAKKIGLSKDTIKYRIQRLTDAGIIQGSLAVIDTACLGFQNYHLILKLCATKKTERYAFIKTLQVYPFTKSIIEASGKYDFEIVIAARNASELDSFVTKLLTDAGTLIQEYHVLILSKTLVSRALPKEFHTSPEKTHLPTINKLHLDETDIKILAMISKDARLPFYSIGNTLGLSGEVIHYRIKKMITQGIINGYRTLFNYAGLGYTFYIIPLRIQSLDRKKEGTLRHMLSDNPHVIWSAKTIGYYNILLYLCIKKSSDLHDTIISLKEQFDILDYETLIAYQDHKYTYYPDICSTN